MTHHEHAATLANALLYMAGGALAFTVLPCVTLASTAGQWCYLMPLLLVARAAWGRRTR